MAIGIRIELLSSATGSGLFESFIDTWDLTMWHFGVYLFQAMV